MARVTDDRRPGRAYLMFRRGFDLLTATLLLLLLSPLLILAAILIRLTGSGPVLFSQDRCGRDGRLFRVCKFRTMRAGRAADPEELVPLDHPEITPIGRLLRRAKIDELPQLWNVVRGDMALIGPRPTLPQQVARYTDFQRQRLLLRPGVTGLAQVNGNAAISWEERIKYDVYYVHHASLWLDVKILLLTIRTVVQGETRYARPFGRSPYAGKAAP
jgi:undecaprenyl phosphate N,N'-diacetylbacillosamine 1-phosphate transferase